MRNFAEHLAKTALLENNGKYSGMDDIASDDVARVRTTMQQDDNASVVQQVHIGDPSDMAEVLLINPRQDNLVRNVDAEMGLQVEAIKDNFFPNIIARRCTNEPINEFTDNMTLLLKGFAHLFIFGKNSMGKLWKGSLPPKYVRHLLYQRTLKFAQDKKFLFTMTNQHMRHCNIRSVTFRAINRPDVMERIGKLSADLEFHETLKRGIANPTGKDARSVLARFDKLVRVVGSKTPYSASERASAISTLYAMAQFYGCPNVFFTFNLDDKHTILSIRMSFPTNMGNIAFPAVDDGLTKALQHDEETFVGDIKLNDYNLIKLINSNPVSAADFFKKTLEAFYEHVVGQKLSRCTQRTVPLGSRKKGIFGRLTAGFHAIETSAKKALHGHFLFWGVLPTEYFQQAAAFSDSIKALTTILEKMFMNDLPATVHMDDMARMMTKPCERERLFPKRFTYYKSPLLSENVEGLGKGLRNMQSCWSAQPCCHLSEASWWKMRLQNGIQQSNSGKDHDSPIGF
jgi:hypothetical protein